MITQTKPDSIELRLPRVRLQAREDHRIDIEYGAQIKADLRPPTCALRRRSMLGDLYPFDVNPSLAELIHRHAGAVDLNAFLVAGIVAQESGFDAHEVSWAKALGLMQITPIAEEEILAFYPNLKRYPGLNDMSAFQIKALVPSFINATNEWRFNPELNIKGGITYIEWILRYWEKQEIVLHQLGSPLDPQEYLSIVLASYHSGSLRVKENIIGRGRYWLSAPNLGEAKRYVRRVKSFCSGFRLQTADSST